MKREIITMRKTLRRTALFFALAVFASVSTFAQTEGPQILTLDRALDIAMDQNRDVQKAQEYRNWVQGKYVEERSAALPHITITASGQRLHDESLRGLYGEYGDLFPVQQDVRTGQVGLTQALYTWGQVGAAIKAAKVGRLVAEDQLRRFRQAVRRDVTAAFYDVILNKKLVVIAQENLDQKARHLAEAKKKYDLGTATDYDVLAAEVAVKNARPTVIRTTNGVRLARERLRFLLAMKSGDFEVRGSLESSRVAVPSYDDALATALDRRPDLKDLEHRVAIQRELVKIARAGDKPRLDFRATYGSTKYIVGDLDSHGKTWSTGIFLSFPIFDGMRSRGQVMQTRSDLTSLEIERAKAIDSVSLELHAALDAVDESYRIVEALEGTVEQAGRLLEMAEKGYEFGVKTKLDVDDAQLNLTQAEGNLAQARRDYLVAVATLRYAMGVIGGSA